MKNCILFIDEIDSLATYWSPVVKEASMKLLEESFQFYLGKSMVSRVKEMSLLSVRLTERLT